MVPMDYWLSWEWLRWRGIAKLVVRVLIVHTAARQQRPLIIITENDKISFCLHKHLTPFAPTHSLARTHETESTLKAGTTCILWCAKKRRKAIEMDHLISTLVSIAVYWVRFIQFNLISQALLVVIRFGISGTRWSMSLDDPGAVDREH